MAVADQETDWEETAGFASSNIAAFRFDKQTDTLQVDFVNGDTYEYYNVPPSTNRAFQASGSKGEFFARAVKGRFSYERI